MTYKDALEILNEHWSGRIDSPDRPDFDDINEALGKMEDAVKQLAEKDKEIERLKNCVMSEEQVRSIMIGEMPTLIKQITPIIRHQICEEIRDELFNTEFKEAINDLGKIWLLNLLEQIEGE